MQNRTYILKKYNNALKFQNDILENVHRINYERIEQKQDIIIHMLSDTKSNTCIEFITDLNAKCQN